MTERSIRICTTSNVWVIPHNCELLKALLKIKRIRARDLHFRSRRECHRFIQQVALLAAKDEIEQSQPSCLAVLAQELIQQQSATTSSSKQT